MTKKEEFQFAAQLAAHERLAELFILVRAQRGSSQRLKNYRDRIAKEIETDEDHPVVIDPKEKAIHERMLQTIDAALGLLANEQKRLRGQS